MTPFTTEKLEASDKNADDTSNQQKREPGEKPRDKPVEEEADKDVKNGGGHRSR
jgi:hypothetical protein